MMHPFKRAVCILLLAVLLAGLWGCGITTESQSYHRGKTALASGRLAEAAELFGSLADYKDSSQKMQIIYDQALELYQRGDHSQAGAVFQVLAEYEIRDAKNYAAASQALVCLGNLDGSGARAALAKGDTGSLLLRDVLAQADQMLFPGTPIFRPEFTARELVSGEVSVRIHESSELSTQEFLYVMDRLASQRIYQQYREYCKNTFPETFRDESENYFSFRADGILCYVSNFYSVDSGLVVSIPGA